MDERKSSPELVKHLGNAVRLRDPKEFALALDALKGKTVIADPLTASAAIFDRLNKAGAKIIEGPVAREGGRRTVGSSVYVRDPDGNLLEFMIYPDKPKECAHAR